MTTARHPLNNTHEHHPAQYTFDDRPSVLADLDQRSCNIFRRLVDTYLETGEPLGSRIISKILPASL